MIESTTIAQVDSAADGTRLFVIGAEYEARYAGLHDCTDAHGARLEGDIERCANKSMVATRLPGSAKRDDLGMTAWIVIGNGPVMRTSNDVATHGYDGPYRNLACSRRALSLLDGLAHRDRVGGSGRACRP